MYIENYLDTIVNLELFTDFTKEQLVESFEINKYYIKKYKKGEIIHFQNEICNSIDVVIIGQVSVQRLDLSGNILTIAMLSQGEVMGANLMFSNKNHYPMTVTATMNTTVLHIQKKLILELCQKNMNFLIGLIRVISDKTITLTDKITSITLKTIRQCIIEFLIYEYHIQKSAVIKLDMTKKELAERFGIQRPSLSRELNKMRKDNLLEYDGHSITIKDLSILKRP